jgi:hypothetical protein
MKGEIPDDKSGDLRVAVWTAGADGRVAARAVVRTA